MRMTHLLRLLVIVGLVVSFLGMHTTAARASGLTFLVTLVNDGSDAHPGDGVCATSSGVCTLRAAIEEANAHAGADVIHFNLPGGGVHVMSISSALPTITQQLTLDGSSQPSCSVPCIVLSGALLTTGLQYGLTITTSNSLVK